MAHIHEKIDFTASVFIVNENAVLLRKHEKFNQWLQPGGHIELDEDPMQAAVREAKEEVGLDVLLVGDAPTIVEGPDFKNLIPPRFLNRHAFPPTPGHEHIDFVYFGTSSSREAKAGAGAGAHERFAEIRWFTKDEIDDLAFGLWPTTKLYAKTALDELST